MPNYSNILKALFTDPEQHWMQALQSGNDQPVLPSAPASTAPQGGDIVQATTDKLFSEGFPSEMVQMFKKTADETNSVVMSRAPGNATPELIEHGHDLKGYQVKAKSCDWGPMSGFLCQVTCFNKKGVEKIEYNDDKYAKYFKYIHEKQKEDLVFHASITRKEDPFTPFIPLKIFDARKVQMLKHKSILHQKVVGNGIYGVAIHTKEVDRKTVPTVVMEFLLRKSDDLASDGSPLWHVYHGRIQTIDPSKKTPGWSDFYDAKISYMDGDAGKEKIHKMKGTKGRKVRDLLQNMPPNLVPADDYKHLDGDTTAITSLTTFLTKDSTLPSPSGNHPGFFPLCVAQNPFPAYAIMEQVTGESEDDYEAYKVEARKDFYKNAVTGDYDLFAVWPVRPDIGWEDMIRLSDIQEKIGDVFASKKATKARKPYKQSFFVTVPGKPFGLGLVGSPNAYIDVIPGFDEIEAWEDPEVGNVNSAVMLAAQTFNSFVCAHMSEKISTGHPAAPGKKTGKERHFAYPNLAFHSDEGGRPGIDEIDLPVGVFLPLKLASIPAVQKILNPAWNEGDLLFIRHMVIGKGEYDRFIGLALALRNTCLISFNHIWLTYLFALVGGTTKSDGFFKPMAEERKELGPEELGRLRAQLALLFLGGTFRIARDKKGTKPWGMTVIETWPLELAAAEKSMDELAKAFVDAVAKTKAKDKRKILKKAMMAIPDRTSPVEAKDDDSDIVAAPSLFHGLQPNPKP